MDNVIKVQCSHCSETFGAKSRNSLGKMARCPKCSKKFVLQEKEPDEDDFLQDIGEFQSTPARQQRRRPARRSAAAQPVNVSDEPKEELHSLARPELRRLRKKVRPVHDDDDDDEGGMFSIGVLAWIVGGSLGALLYLMVWGGVAFVAHWPMGWMAIGMGFVVGIGVRLAAGESDGIAPGLTAAAITLVAIVLAKFLVAGVLTIWLAQHFVQIVDDVDTLAVRQIADEIVDERIDAGQEVEWPEQEVRLFGGVEQDVSKEYPAAIWGEAELRWQNTPIEEQQKRREEAEKEKERAVEEKQDVEGKFYLVVLVLCFGLFDLIWIPMSVFTAFQIGANVAGN